MLCQQEFEKLDGQFLRVGLLPCVCGLSSGNETVVFSNKGGCTDVSIGSRITPPSTRMLKM